MTTIHLKVRWVEKSNEPPHHVRQIGGASGELRWKHTCAQAVEWIERGQFAYYVERNARILSLEVARATDGEKYLIVHAADEQLLLDLPSFPEAHQNDRPAPTP
ncbi:MAG TPA: DUF3892 domain-containing protein [Verrucomicrobiae bacterium]|nr:DUF3892 domain-containing protein [Verrucomicrobiae bacterium]